MSATRMAPTRSMRRLLVLLLFLLGTSAGLASTANAGPASGPTGYSRLSAQWWEWILQQPASSNPLLDTKGTRCGIGQHGDVWFLAGAPESGKPVSRNCVIPATKPLFFPIVNAFSCALRSDPHDQQNVAYQRSVVAHVKKDARELRLWVDGKRLDSSKLVFSRSEVFAVYLPPGNLFGVPAQVCRPGVDSGYYVRLTALEPGTHTLRWHGVLLGPNESSRTVQDVTYHLRVLPPVR